VGDSSSEVGGSLESQITEILDETPGEPEVEIQDDPIVPVAPVETTAPAVESVVIPPVEPTVSTVVEPPSEIDALKAQVASMTTLINQLSSGQPTTPAPVATPVVVEPPALGIKELMEAVDFDQVMESKEAFVNFMTSVLEAVSKNTLGRVNEVVPEVITRQSAMEKVRTEFYSAYPELEVVQPYVAQVANGIGAANPTWTVPQVLAEAAKVAKAALNIPDRVVTTPAASTSTGAPILPGGSTAVRKPAPKGSKLQADIDELLSD